MNIFRLAGDMAHLASTILLLSRIHTTQSCAGISLRTHELYALVYVTRYLDVLTIFISLYNTTMKLIYLLSSFAMLWYMRGHGIVRKSYDKDLDTFRHYVLILCCLILALATNELFNIMEITWTFSQFLEAFAILPQLVLLQRTNNTHILTWQYVLLLGIYRPLYIANWIYKYFTNPFFMSWLSSLWKSYVSGVIQTVIYGVFCYYYINSRNISKTAQLEDGQYMCIRSPTNGENAPLKAEEAPANAERAESRDACSLALTKGAAVSSNEKIHLLV
ncbi:ER lumen protein-retaining receptor [Iris pallida]|uniref:ER lumen protein-retaining receptor n=1 Tax=Iris pallida TaxID=29817 RepID=A0AAX6H8U9_IRIPA|nr:ER lumen protein-retaining receptor [Iris pallida]